MLSKGNLFIFLSSILLLPSIWNFFNKNCNYFTDYLFCSSSPTLFIKYLNFGFIFTIFISLSLIYYKIISRYRHSLAPRRHSRESGNLVWKHTAIIVFIFFLISPIGTTDIFYYRGVVKGDIAENINPYFGGFSKEINFLNLKFENLSPVMYSPLYLQINKSIYTLSPNNEFLSIYLYKFFALGVFMLCAIIIYKYFGREKTILFIFNPLFPFEFVTNAHLDIYMFLFLILSIIFTIKNKIYFSIISIFLASLIKFNALICLPLFILYYLSTCKNLKQLLGKIAEIFLGVLSGISITAMFYAPYWKGIDTLNGFREQSDWSFNTLIERFTFSPLNPTYHVYKEWNSKSFVIVWGVFVLIGVCLFAFHFFKNLYSAVKHKRIYEFINTNTLFFYSGLMFFLLPALMMRSFLPWYLTWSSLFFIFSEFKNKNKVLFLLTLILAIYYPTVYLIGHFNYFQNNNYYSSLVLIEAILNVFILRNILSYQKLLNTNFCPESKHKKL